MKLTSSSSYASHVPFVTGLEAYDQVLGYDQVGSLTAGPASLVDIAGDAALRDAIEPHLGLRGEVVVAGVTHGEAEPLAAGAFSAPQRIQDRAREWGWPVLEQRYQAALHGFAVGTAAWLAIRRHHGLDGAARVYREVLTDASPPAAAHVVEPALSRSA